MLTGNYNFFNLLTIALALALVDETAESRLAVPRAFATMLNVSAVACCAFVAYKLSVDFHGAHMLFHCYYYFLAWQSEREQNIQ